MNFCQKISGSFSILKISPFCTLQIGIFFSTKTWTRKPPWPQNIRLNVGHFFWGRIPPTEKNMALMGFSAVFCFSFGGVGWNLSFQGSLHGLWPETTVAAAEANCFPPMNPTKDVSSRFFWSSTSRQIYGKFSFHTEAKGKGPVVAFVFHSDLCFMFQNFRPTAQGQAGHLPSQAPGGFRSVDVLAQTQHANLAQAFCSSLQGVPQGEWNSSVCLWNTSSYCWWKKSYTTWCV